MLKKLLIIVLAIVGASIAYLYATRHTPVLYRYVDRASVEHSAFIIQNPFRDRSPELQAERVLAGLKSGKCHDALQLAQLDAARVQYLCERENSYPLQGWSLMDREDDGQSVRLVYDVYRDFQGSGARGLVWIEVESSDGQWRSTFYDTYY